MTLPRYDITRLTQEAKRRLLLDGHESNDLAIYHMVAKLRTEELRQARHQDDPRPLTIAGGCIE